MESNHRTPDHAGQSRERGREASREGISLDFDKKMKQSFPSPTQEGRGGETLRACLPPETTEDVPVQSGQIFESKG